MTTKLYDTDFYSWAMHQAGLLRNEDYAELDLDNLIEEIEDMARRHRDAGKPLDCTLRHLLKLACLPDSNPSRGWRLTVKEQRYQISILLENNPSLRRVVPELISKRYGLSCDLATDDLANDDLAGDTLPVACPWTADQILDVKWLPG